MPSRQTQTANSFTSDSSTMDDSSPEKLFVGGISMDTTERTLEDYFSTFGEVGKSEVIREKFTGVSRCFGFITFANHASNQRALEENEHVILGRKVEVKVARPETDKHQCQHFTTIDPRKIFVGGLPSSLTEEEFRIYFERFGVVTEAFIAYDKERRSPKGFGFIKFDSEEAAETVLQTKLYEIRGKSVEVKRCKPKDLMVREKIFTFVPNYNGYSCGEGYFNNKPSTGFTPNYNSFRPNGPCTGYYDGGQTRERLGLSNVNDRFGWRFTSHAPYYQSTAPMVYTNSSVYPAYNTNMIQTYHVPEYNSFGWRFPSTTPYYHANPMGYVNPGVYYPYPMHNTNMSYNYRTGLQINAAPYSIDDGASISKPTDENGREKGSKCILFCEEGGASSCSNDDYDGASSWQSESGLDLVQLLNHRPSSSGDTH